jgi:hypothetical protein
VLRNILFGSVHLWYKRNARSVLSLLCPKKLLLILGRVCEILELSILTLKSALVSKEARLWSYLKLLHKSYKNNYTDSRTLLGDERQSAHIMIIHASNEGGPPLWSNGQSSWLQIRRPGFDSRHYQKKK